MNNKGFTIIEIIIAVVLVTLIGTSTTVILIKNNKTNIEQEEVFKKTCRSSKCIFIC